MIRAGYKKFTMIKDATFISGTWLQVEQIIKVKTRTNPVKMKRCSVHHAVKEKQSKARKGQEKKFKKAVTAERVKELLRYKIQTKYSLGGKFLDIDRHDTLWWLQVSYNGCISGPFPGKVQP